MLAQVPPWTNFQALPWKSMVEVPWQVVPGPAAQSFWPFMATPKHFSFFAATAASASALVSGPATASVASAVETAPASMSELTVVLADMRVLLLKLHRGIGDDASSFRRGRAAVTVRLAHDLVRPLGDTHDAVRLAPICAEPAGQRQCLV